MSSRGTTGLQRGPGESRALLSLRDSAVKARSDGLSCTCAATHKLLIRGCCVKGARRQAEGRSRRSTGGAALLGLMCRRAVAAWGLKLCTQRPEWHSDTVTAVVVPAHINSNDIVRLAWKKYNLSLGLGLNKINGKVFRIGHLGQLNEVWERSLAWLALYVFLPGSLFYSIRCSVQRLAADLLGGMPRVCSAGGGSSRLLACCKGTLQPVERVHWCRV